MIRARGSNFTASSDAVFQAAATGAKICALLSGLPRTNAICERVVGTALQLAVKARRTPAVTMPRYRSTSPGVGA